jgi:hypothetical protein
MAYDLTLVDPVKSWICIFMLLIIIILHAICFLPFSLVPSNSNIPILIAQNEFSSFIPNSNLQRTSEGYLVDNNTIPIRAFARNPHVPLFENQQMNRPKGTAYMSPWKPYFIFDLERINMTLQIGESKDIPPNERHWVRSQDCFCWSTRECLNIEKPSAIYRTLEEAKTKKNPLDMQYQYTFKDNFERKKLLDRKSFLMPSLPVLYRVDTSYWCFLFPEGDENESTAEAGWSVRWLEWDGRNPNVTVRIRITRWELETFIGNLQTLLLEYEAVPEKRDGTKWEMYNRGVRNFTWQEFQRMNRTQVRKGLDGLPIRPGFMGQRIESELQAQKIKERIVALARWINSEIWTSQDVSFIDAEMIP